MLESLHFSYGGFDAGCTDIDITVKKGMVTAKVASIVNPDKIAPIHLSKKASQKWLAALDELKVTRWRAYYAPVGAMVLDGIQWSLDVKYEGKRCRHIHGDNAFPNDWYYFLDLMERFYSFSEAGQIDKAEFDIEIHHDIPDGGFGFPFTQRDRLTVDRKKRIIEHKREDGNTTVTNSIVGDEADEILWRIETLMPKMNASIIPENKSTPMLNLTVTYHTGETVKMRTSFDRLGLPYEWSEFASSVLRCFSRYGYCGLLLSESIYMSGRKDGEYIYLSVSFQNSESGKLYYYLTDDDNIAVDDQVVVPVGNEGKQRICNVEKVEYYTADEVPMPIDKVKHIIGKFNPYEPIYCPVCNKAISNDDCYEIALCSEGIGCKSGVEGVETREVIEAHKQECLKCKYHPD